MDKIKCFSCGYPNASHQIINDTMGSFYVCPVCGRYELTESELMKPSLDKNKLTAFLFYNGFHRSKSGLTSELRYYTTLDKEICDKYVSELKNGNNTHGHPVHLDNDIINAWYPKSFAEKIDMILLQLDLISDYIGQEVTIDKFDLFGLTFVELYKSEGKEELSDKDIFRQAFFYINYLIDSGYIKGNPAITGDKAGPYTITPNGYQRIDKIQKDTGNGRNVLVAMKFGDDTLKLREAIKQGIRDANYNPILIDEVEHNELITPELLSNIRKSRFVVVDLTHQNNGAYFEEGYAMGLGKPVIQLCQKETKLHFDIAQKNTIIWDKEEDIPLRLMNRIKATID